MTHFVSASTRGEICGMCYRAFRSTPATHKVGEEIPTDGKGFGHNLTQYVCCAHFGQIFRPESAITWRGCIIEEPGTQNIASIE